ncbi:MAG: hypothetical protein KDK04_25180 [Candidatus Competibacteraceae bacterium]|nr:hypothetical protein [Candidatus Competibacteraceae bacterium]MCB1806276.1 hypothetical protein [Candidatus Competibacteraceae bacterium]MCB1814983.1 hypothetical protein [Candidatus Competibacteraceae bacterium]
MSFQALTECLNSGERLRIELAVEGETLTVLIQPLLKAASVQQSDEQLKLRAGLAHPLRLSASASDLDASLISSPAPGMDETASDAANAAPSTATLEPALAVPETANPDSLF